MNAKVAQLLSFVSKFDRRYIQLAYFVVALTGFVVLGAPSEGGGGGI